MNDRQPAEELCSLAMTSALGDLNLRANSARDAATVPGWVDWLARAAARELGLPDAKVDHAYLTKVRDTVDILIADQIVYHRANAHRMHQIESRLHSAGEALFGGTMVACALWIAAKLANVPMNFGGGNWPHRNNNLADRRKARAWCRHVRYRHAGRFRRPRTELGSNGGATGKINARTQGQST